VKDVKPELLFERSGFIVFKRLRHTLSAPMRARLSYRWPLS